MSAVKESLRETIELLSEEEALQTLEFAQRLRDSSISDSFRRLASDPTFKIPTRGVSKRRGNPMEGKGIPASQLLVEERR